MCLLFKRLVLVLLIFYCYSCSPDNTAMVINTGLEFKPLPTFTLIQPDGRSLSSAKFNNNEKLVLFFFSPTCPYCRTQLRETLNNIKESSNKQLCIVLVADKKSLKDFNSYFKLSRFKNISIGVDTGNIIQRTYNVSQVPFTALFNQKMTLEKAYLGRLSGKTLLSVIN